MPEPKSYVILTLPEHWTDWIGQVSAEAAKYHKVWDYINPGSEHTVVAPKEPERVKLDSYIHDGKLSELDKLKYTEAM